MNRSTQVARAVVGALVANGVTDVVLAPGSRSAPLALAVHAAETAGRLRLHVRIDERTAGYLALGLAKGSHRPVAIVTTSGTAVANLHPAVLEASHVGERILVLSADRPAALRGTGANQTTVQPGMFGAGVPCADLAPGAEAAAESAVAAAVRRLGPSHLNLQFAEPLLPDSADSSRPPAPLPTGEAPADEAALAAMARPERLPFGPRTVVVAGDDAGPPARLLAQRAGWPLLAEPTSGARTGTHAIRCYRLLLAGPLGDSIERVVVAGHPTLSRPVTRLISRGDIEVVAVRGRGGYATDPGRVARVLDTVPDTLPDTVPDTLPDTVPEGGDGDADAAWLQRWRSEDARVSSAVDEVARSPEGTPLRVAAAVAAAVTPEALLVVGSSSPVRDLDVMAPAYPAGERRLVVGNRGLAGIDGTLSTAVGAALGRRSSRSLAYVGDLTFLHDANGLVMGPDEPRPDLTIVVANDDGGALFTTLEQGGPAHRASFERLFGTPSGVDLAALCAATGTAYERVTADALPAALDRDERGIRVIEVSLSRAARRDLDARLRSLV